MAGGTSQDLKSVISSSTTDKEGAPTGGRRLKFEEGDFKNRMLKVVSCGYLLLWPSCVVVGSLLCVLGGCGGGFMW
jgi:hypothetical protein